MKIKHFLTLFLTLLFVVSAFAQTKILDSIRLKNGSKVNGIIVELVKNEYVIIDTDGRILRFENEAVRKIIDNREIRAAQSTDDPVANQSTIPTTDEIYLTDGSVVRGEITEMKAGEYVEIRLEGEIVRFTDAETERIVTGAAAPARTPPVNTDEERPTLDIIYLKGGSRVRGQIKEFVENEYVTIDADGRILRFEMSEVRRILNDREISVTKTSPSTENNGPTAVTPGEMLDKIFLKNGDTVSGKIQDIRPGEYTDIEIDGDIHRFSAQEINRIVTEKPPVPEPKKVRPIIDPSKIRTEGIYKKVTLTFAAGKNLEESFSLGPGIHFAAGKQFSPFAGIGLGFGTDNYRSSIGETVYPVYADYRMYPFKNDRGYYLNVAGGYGFAFARESKDLLDADGGLYFSPVIGYRSASKNNVSMNLEIGYKYQRAYFEEQSDRTGNDIEMRDMHYQRLVLSLGVMFW